MKNIGIGISVTIICSGIGVFMFQFTHWSVIVGLILMVIGTSSLIYFIREDLIKIFSSINLISKKKDEYDEAWDIAADLADIEEKIEECERLNPSKVSEINDKEDRLKRLHKQADKLRKKL